MRRCAPKLYDSSIYAELLRAGRALGWFIPSSAEHESAAAQAWSAGDRIGRSWVCAPGVQTHRMALPFARTAVVMGWERSEGALACAIQESMLEVNP